MFNAECVVEFQADVIAGRHVDVPHTLGARAVIVRVVGTRYLSTLGVDYSAAS